jgi:hypothetical protein
MVMAVLPPPVGPVPGVTLEMVGARYENPLFAVKEKLWPDTVIDTAKPVPMP